MTLRPNWIAIATCLFINCPSRCLNLQHLKIRSLSVTFHLALAEPIMALRENGGGRDVIASMAPSFIYSYAHAKTPRYPPSPVTICNCDVISPEILKCCSSTSETMSGSDFRRRKANLHRLYPT